MTLKSGGMLALLVAAVLLLAGEQTHYLRARLQDWRLRRAMNRRGAVLPETWRSTNAERLAGALNEQRGR
jgi:hypothetical protein